MYDLAIVRRVIGYYVHHQGMGHLHRARAIIAALGEPVTVLSSLPRPTDWAQPWLQLPIDTDAHPVDPDAGRALHWVPIGSPGLRERAAAVSAWIADSRPAAVIVDVSVEVATLVRIHGVPVITVAQPGDRTDRAHTLGFGLSTAVIAPWMSGIRALRVDPEVERRIDFVGAISRIPVNPGTPRRLPHLAVMNGSGGRGASALDQVVAESMAAAPGLDWVRLAGESETTVERTLRSASVVFAHCGQNAIAEIAASRVPAILVPEERPHREQRYMAEALASSALPVVISNPGDGRDRAADIHRARAMDGGSWLPWMDGLAAARAADVVRRVVTMTSRPTHHVATGSAA
ncbi:hypothetical protein IWX81_002284 [Salinibacterium sp. CAN_S4]|uniref:glycosyltransferase n=1 Tax=Salinibacterium sp. CAN_S4 TaxID=2787727 RepID=UPI0018EFDA97